MITTTGSGPNGWGIELTNNGVDLRDHHAATASSRSPRRTPAAFCSTTGAADLLNGGGYWDDSVTRLFVPVGSRPSRSTAAAPTSIHLRGGPGEAIIGGGTRQLPPEPERTCGSITLLGGTVRNSTAGIYNQTGTQTISTTGAVRAHRRFGARRLGRATSAVMCRPARTSASGVGRCADGQRRKHRDRGRVGRWPQRGEHLLVRRSDRERRPAASPSPAARAWPGQLGLALRPASRSRSISAAVTITLQTARAGDARSTANVYSDGSQTIIGHRRHRAGGRGRRLAGVGRDPRGTSQDITARSISITATAGPSSTGHLHARRPADASPRQVAGGNAAITASRSATWVPRAPTRTGRQRSATSTIAPVRRSSTLPTRAASCSTGVGRVPFLGHRRSIANHHGPRQRREPPRSERGARQRGRVASATERLRA